MLGIVGVAGMLDIAGVTGESATGRPGSSSSESR
jgi:hypothetical protein